VKSIYGWLYQKSKGKLTSNSGEIHITPNQAVLDALAEEKNDEESQKAPKVKPKGAKAKAKGKGYPKEAKEAKEAKDTSIPGP